MPMIEVKMVQEYSANTPLKCRFEIDFGKWPVQICPDAKALKARWTYFHLTKCPDAETSSRPKESIFTRTKFHSSTVNKNTLSVLADVSKICDFIFLASKKSRFTLDCFRTALLLPSRLPQERQPPQPSSSLPTSLPRSPLTGCCRRPPCRRRCSPPPCSRSTPPTPIKSPPHSTTSKHNR